MTNDMYSHTKPVQGRSGDPGTLTEAQRDRQRICEDITRMAYTLIERTATGDDATRARIQRRLASLVRDTQPEARAALDRHITEAAFQRQVIDLAEMCGWAVYHNPDSRRSTAGYPDLTLCHEDTSRPVVFLELKTEKGRVRPAQRWWLERLDPGPVLQDYVVARVVRPRDWPWIEALLTDSDWRETA